MDKSNLIKTQEAKCKYMTGLMCGGSTVCKAGVDVRELVGGDNFGWLARIPCNTINETDIVCDKFCVKTQQELDEEDSEWKKLLNKIQLIDPLVAQLKDKFYKKGEDATGFEICPACKGNLVWGISGYNGHIRMQCKTDKCISLIE